MRPLKLLLAASLVLPTAVAGAVGYWSYNQVLDDAEVRSRQTAFILREHALRVFEAQESAIASIDGRIAGMSWDDIERSAEIHELLRSMRDSSPHIDGLWLVRPEGRAANSADFFPVPHTEPTDREYFRILKERDITHLGEMIRGYLKGNLNFNLSRRRSSVDGDFDGLILVTISLSYFEAFWRDILGDDLHVASILRQDGKILARFPGLGTVPQQIPAASPFFSGIGSHGSGTYVARSAADGRERIYSYARLGTFPAYLVIGFDRASVLKAWWREIAVIAALAAVITLMLTAAARAAMRRQNLLHQEITRRRAAESNLIAKEEHVAALERAEAELRESEERFRALFETLTEGVLYFDARGRIVSGNAASEGILGLTANEMRHRPHGDPRWLVVEADGRECLPDQQPTFVALRTGSIVRDRLLGVYNPTRGERRWLKVTAIPQRSGEGELVGVFSVFSDVTEQLRTQQAQDLLIREVDHRAKNALAVVQAILRLTRAETIREFIQAVEGRVAAMARAHTLLAKSRWEGADLRSLIEEELAPYRPVNGATLHVEGPDLVLQTDATQAIGMVIHELATNAAKYGGLANPQGELTVTWKIRQGDGSLELLWSETAGRKIEAPSRSGFGSSLIRSTIEGQLGGELETRWQEKGLEAVIRIPPRHVTRGSNLVVPSTTPEPLTRTRQFQGMRVLLAEDNAAVALELVDLLKEFGCDVIGPAAQLDAAARLALAEPVDLALLDVDLQGQAVFPVADLLESFGVPVVFCTGFGDPEAGQLGRRDHVPVVRKPFARDELARAMAAAKRAATTVKRATG